jgi:hypothetical protein
LILCDDLTPRRAILFLVPDAVQRVSGAPQSQDPYVAGPIGPGSAL